MKPLLLAIDQGTTSSRAIAFDTNGAIVASAQAEFPQIYPAAALVEHDPEAIWSTTIDTARNALADAEARGGRVACIGITNQRETTIVWDRKTLKPIANAIVWQDRRTAPQCTALLGQGAEDLVRRRTGLLLDPYFSATKLAWLLDNIDGARSAANAGRLAFGTVDAFLLSRLTGRHATDATNASRTSLYNIHTNAWDPELLDLFNTPAACLPEVLDSADDFGMTAPDLFGRPIRVCAMIGDQQAAAVGQACLSPGDIKSTYGTGCFMLAETGTTPVMSSNRLVTTISKRIEGRTTYALEGSIFVAGAAVQWLRDNLGLIASSSETEALARSIADTNGVYLVPAFAGLGAPHWRADARAAIVGLTRGSGRAEIVRAALEAVVFQSADLLEAMQRDGAPASTLKVDGGMVANAWLLQRLADILNAPVERPRILETTALGAAFLAGLKAGIFSALSDVASLRRTEHTFLPAMSDAERSRLVTGWRKALSQVLS